MRPNTTMRLIPILFLTVATLRAQDYWPTSDASWQTLSPAAAGADPVKLVAAIDFAAARNSKALVILKGGRIVSENHWQGSTRETSHVLFSATKGVTASLVGIAIAEGRISSSQTKAATYLPEWSGVPGKQDISLHHLMSMTSGLEGGAQNLILSQLARSERNFAVQLPLTHAPGSHWDYNNPAYRLLFTVLTSATGQSLPALTSAQILQPLGMTHTFWNFRTASIGTQTITNYEHLSASALDAARFGLCVSRGGNWQGVPVIPAGWLATCLAASQARNSSYGLLWWLNSGGSHLIPLDDRLRAGQLCPDVPPDAYAALGNDDQKIYVIPSLDLVIVRLGNAAANGAPAISAFDNELLGRIANAFGYQGPEQVLALETSLPSPGLFRLQLQTWSGRGYTIETSPDLRAPWLPLAGYASFVGDGLPVTVDLPVSPPAAFFRAVSGSLVE